MYNLIGNMCVISCCCMFLSLIALGISSSITNSRAMKLSFILFLLFIISFLTSLTILDKYPTYKIIQEKENRIKKVEMEIQESLLDGYTKEAFIKEKTIEINELKNEISKLIDGINENSNKE